MKKITLSALATLTCCSLFAQSIEWNLTSVQSSLKTLIPNLLGLVCFIVVFGWTVWNLVTNWKDRAEILTNAGWMLIIILVAYGMVYGAMNVLLV